MVKRTALIVSVVIVFTALVIGFQVAYPPAQPHSAEVHVRPLAHAQTVTAATAQAGAPSSVTREIVREVVITQIVPATRPPEDDQPGAGAPRVAIVLVTPTPGAGAPPTAAPTPARKRTNAEEGYADSPVETPVAVSPLPTPVSPLATPVGPLPPGDAQAAAYDLINAVVASETAYYAQYGAFAQLLLADTATCPEDQRCISIGYPPGMAAGVNVYLAPDGSGYEVEVVSGHWRLLVATGPEAEFRNEGWSYAE
jgi:cell division protein FtsN